MTVESGKGSTVEIVNKYCIATDKKFFIAGKVLRHAIGADLIGKWSAVSDIWNLKVNRILENMGEQMWLAEERTPIAIKGCLVKCVEVIPKVERYVLS